MIAFPYNVIGLVALVIGLFGSGYFYGRHVEHVKMQAIIDSIKISQQAVLIKAQADNDALKTKLQEKKHAAENAIDILMHSKPSGGLQLPTTCARSDNQDSPIGSQPATTGNRAFSTETQAAFDRFTKGLDELTYEADKLTEQCRVVVEWAKNTSNNLAE